MAAAAKPIRAGILAMLWGAGDRQSRHKLQVPGWLPKQVGENGLLLGSERTAPRRIELALAPPKWQVNFVLFAVWPWPERRAGTTARSTSGRSRLTPGRARTRDFIRLGSCPTRLTFLPRSDRLSANSWEGLTVAQDLAAARPSLSIDLAGTKPAGSQTGP